MYATIRLASHGTSCWSWEAMRVCADVEQQCQTRSITVLRGCYMIRPLSSLRRWRTEVLVIGGYLLLTLLFTYPLVLHLGAYVVGLHVDVEQYLWSFWWMRRALLELHTTPFFTHWLYYP